MSLMLVYLLVIGHIIHWQVSGRTLAPLELSETMHTLERGIITAGFLFMCVLIIGTLVAGRFFCSWACHMIALQDLCAWLLRKMRIKPAPIRSRLLLWAPPVAAVYMFIWPQIERVWHGDAFPPLRWADESEGWASIVTDEFWRNLPGPVIATVTLLICGFAVVYFLGSRSFCNYVCPYGALFGWVDRLAPLRIRVTDACIHCAKCTAACPTGIRVHEEVKQHRMVVNPACMKDLDCVAACPENALYYGVGAPSLLRSRGPRARFGLKYTFSWPEELLLAAVFIASELSLRGLFNRIPFFLSLTAAAIVAVCVVTTVRVRTHDNLKLASWKLKSGGKLQPAGRRFLAAMPLVIAGMLYAGFVRYHEFVGLRQAALLNPGAKTPVDDATIRSAATHLQTALRWSPFENDRIDRRLLQAATHLGEYATAESAGRRLIRRFPQDRRVRLQLGQVLLLEGRIAEARDQFQAIVGMEPPVRLEAREDLASAHQALAELAVQRGDLADAVDQLQAAIDASPARAALYEQLGRVLAESGASAEAIRALRRAVDLDDSLGGAHYNLGVLLAHSGDYAAALESYRRAAALLPEDADVRNNLGFTLLRLKRDDEAREALEAALAINPQHAGAHFNLAMVLARLGDEAAAETHLDAAIRLDSRFADVLSDADAGASP
ncbi:MAG: tetratricopeptide repeat protein [Planctomycetota bacterium]|nr:MAG: tetratricopeptide repeat protein [Planctomycetota bacterium]